jgi:PTS system nitrogen regulatory IIA component
MDLTVKDAARLLNSSENTIYRWLRDGTLPSYRVNEKYRLNRVELLEWATARGMKVSPDIFHEEEEPVPEKLLADAVRRGGVIYDLPGTDKRTVLRAVCDQIALPASVNRDELFNVLLAREALGSTGIGNGIAIPHPRGPIILGVKEPEVSVVFLKQPIDFGALDGKPVGTLFVIISTTVRLHLKLLSHLMYALQDLQFRAILARRAKQEQIVAMLDEVGARLKEVRPQGATQ